VVDPYSFSINLNIGDIIFDPESKESGILVRKIDLLENFNNQIEEKLPGINAWEILWSGSEVSNSTVRMYVYTESGLINMIREGLFELYQNN
tara:strand:- start:2979 stop:3254 length:276 start_codon:yes stop_codon:yes gene_type:complete